MSHSTLDGEPKFDMDGACNQQHLNQGKSERFALFNCCATCNKDYETEINCTHTDLFDNFVFYEKG